MEKVILTDCDGCLLNWVKAFEQYMEEKGYHRAPGTDDQYSLAKRYNICESEGHEVARKFNSSKKMKTLEPHKDAVKYVRLLHNEGFEFIVISSMSEQVNAKGYRFENLINVFGEDIFTCKRVHCLPTGADKQEVLEQWSDKGYFWIEDHFRNAEAGHEVGLRSVLIDSSYNRHYETDLFPRVSEHHPWKDIYNLVTDHYSKL